MSRSEYLMLVRSVNFNQNFRINTSDLVDPLPSYLPKLSDFVAYWSSSKDSRSRWLCERQTGRLFSSFSDFAYGIEIVHIYCDVLNFLESYFWSADEYIDKSTLVTFVIPQGTELVGDSPCLES